MWINKTGDIYTGECAAGDRKATDAEVAAWKLATAPDHRAVRMAAYPPMTDFDLTTDWLMACDKVNATYPKPK